MEYDDPVFLQPWCYGWEESEIRLRPLDLSVDEMSGWIQFLRDTTALKKLSLDADRENFEGEVTNFVPLCNAIYSNSVLEEVDLSLDDDAGPNVLSNQLLEAVDSTKSSFKTLSLGYTTIRVDSLNLFLKKTTSVTTLNLQEVLCFEENVGPTESTRTFSARA